MEPGGRSPEELETLLEDALLSCDADVFSGLFRQDGVLVISEAGRLTRGPADLTRVSALLERHAGGYIAEPCLVLQARRTALVMGDHGINVARRDRSGSWRYAISVLTW